MPEAEAFQEILSRHNTADDFFRVADKLLPDGGKMNPLSLDVNELDAELGVKRLDLLRHRRLADEEPFCGDTEALLFGNNIERHQLLNVDLRESHNFIAYTFLALPVHRKFPRREPFSPHAAAAPKAVGVSGQSVQIDVQAGAVVHPFRSRPGACCGSAKARGRLLSGPVRDPARGESQGKSEAHGEGAERGGSARLCQWRGC